MGNLNWLLRCKKKKRQKKVRKKKLKKKILSGTCKIEENVDDDFYISQRSDGTVAISFQRKSDSHISSSSSSRQLELRR